MALFNIRVYGILIDDQNRLLVSDEFIRGNYYTKLPGGGLEIGEGTRDCLKREFMEETGLDVTVGEHFYTTDFYQPTTLLPSEMQLFNVYYTVHIDRPYPFITTEKIFDIPAVDGAQSFRWMKINELKEEDFTFPIDRFIVNKIKLELK